MADRMRCLRRVRFGEASRPLADEIGEYCAAHRASWEIFVEALRARGDEREALLLRHRFAELEARKVGQTVIRAQEELLRDR
jgi:hypothetical protein